MAPRRAATQALSQSTEALDDDAARSKRSVRKPSGSRNTAPNGDTAPIGTDAASSAAPTTYRFSTEAARYNLDSVIQFGITAVVTLTLQTVLSAAVEKVQGRNLGTVSRHFHSTWSILGLTAWKVVELAVGWYAGYGSKYLSKSLSLHFMTLTLSQGVAIAAFLALLRLPQMYFLNAFYDVAFFPLLAELVTHFSAAYLAFSIYRRPAVYIPVRDSGVIDRNMRADSIFQITCALYSTSLYALVVLASIYTWLPVHLIIHWDALKTLENVHQAGVLSMFQHLIGMGWCTIYLLLDYVPVALDKGAQSKATLAAYEAEPFDPSAATLWETVKYNIDNLLFWQHAKPSGKAILKHTLFLAACLTIDSAFQSCATIEGCEIASLNWITGPLPWGALWGLGMLFSGVSLGWVTGAWS